MHKDLNIDNIESLQKKLEDFQGRVTKELEEIRQCKREIQQIRDNLMEEMGDNFLLPYGKYIRNDQRIILSAPEIVIGNVDKYGVLFNEPSKVVVRGNDVNLEGVGLDEILGGSVTTRAARVCTIAEDPGKDGMEHAVLPVSEVVSQARSISQITEDVEGVFLSPAVAGTMGIELRSETGIVMDATASSELKKNVLKNRTSDLKERIKNLETNSKDQKKKVESYLKDLQKLMKTEDLAEDVISTRTSYLDIEELHENFNDLTVTLFSAMSNYFQTLSQLAEANRQKTAIETMEKEVDKKKSTFKDKTTHTFISMQSEWIDMLSVDGDGNFRENPEAGVSINAKHVDITTCKADESLHDESTITMTSRTVEINTLNPKVERDDKGEITKGDYPAVGDVIIQSKNIQMEAVDYEWKDKKIQEKTLTKDGKIAMRAETIDAQATDTEGKATGQIGLNAKAVEVRAMDVDKEKRTDKELAAGSTMLLLAEKMFVGAKDSKNRSKQMQVVGDKTMILADTTLELQQDKAVVQLSGGNAAVGGSKLDLYGTTTLQSDTTAKGKLTGGDIEMKNMKVSSSFKTPCTTEGVAVPGAPATGKLSAKLKEEELKSKA